LALLGNELLPLAAIAMVRQFRLAAAVIAFSAARAMAQEPGPFPPPKMEPPIVTPGKTSADPPSDALILFDGKSLAKWRSGDGSAAKWQVRDGYMEVAPGTGDIQTADPFGDCQLHIE